jgi:large conductance mechanosensitive channel
MGIVKEFREFAVKGSAMDMAVGIIVGAAFGKIVTSLVNDVIMPPVGLILGGVDLADMKVVFKPAVLDAAGKVLDPGVALRYGAFINTVFDFLIVAFCIFLMIKVLNMLRRVGERAPA